jgi:2'-5' RNA ligase
MVVLRNKFSLVIEPSTEVIMQVDYQKQKLGNLLNDRYPSKNAKAHITINVFLADEIELKSVIRYLDHFRTRERPFEVNFKGIKHYENGAVYIAPKADSRKQLTMLMKRVSSDFPIKTDVKSTEPHISIGRKLTEEQVLLALKKLYTHFSFQCDTLLLRKFDENKKQYQPLIRFEMGFSTGLSHYQMELFP